jgi:hypothetical protein
VTLRRKVSNHQARPFQGRCPKSPSVVVRARNLLQISKNKAIHHPYKARPDKHTHTPTVLHTRIPKQKAGLSPVIRSQRGQRAQAVDNLETVDGREAGSQERQRKPYTRLLLRRCLLYPISFPAKLRRALLHYLIHQQKKAVICLPALMIEQCGRKVWVCLKSAIFLCR